VGKCPSLSTKKCVGNKNLKLPKRFINMIGPTVVEPGGIGKLG